MKLNCSRLAILHLKMIHKHVLVHCPFTVISLKSLQFLQIVFCLGMDTVYWQSTC